MVEPERNEIDRRNGIFRLSFWAEAPRPRQGRWPLSPPPPAGGMGVDAEDAGLPLFLRQGSKPEGHDAASGAVHESPVPEGGAEVN